MRTETRIVKVVHENGEPAMARDFANGVLFEVIEGPSVGMRGSDITLFDLVGHIRWDRSQISIYETGERRTV